MDATEIPTHPKKVAFNSDFIAALGMFHQCCSAFDTTMDFAIYEMLKVTMKQAHMITSGMMSGAKARLLADLIGHSNHKNKAILLGALNKSRNNKRDIITHGYIWSDSECVKFIERKKGGSYTAKAHSFTLETFVQHVFDFNKNTVDFYVSFGISDNDLNEFANAALQQTKEQ